MAALIQAGRQRLRQRGPPAERIFHTRVSLFNLSERKIVKRYRLSSHAIIDLLGEIEDDLQPSTQRSHAIPAVVKLLSTLQFLATGSFQTVVGVCAGISQTSFCRLLPEVLDALLKRTPQYIKFPTSEEEINRTQQEFLTIGNLPNVIGLVDCTHVQLVPPASQEHIYRNRKHTHSMNMQVICDARRLITNVVAKYPGSVHDSFIFRNSAIYRQLRNGPTGDAWLLGK